MSKVTHMSLDEEGAGRRRIHLREISGDSETPLETVGQELRAARLRRGDDLATVSRALKIRKDHLSAVEDDNLEGLPGKTYALGFVRSYATYLGLDSVEMVERFKQETSGRHDELSSASVVPDEEGRKLPYGWRIVAGVVLLALAYGTWHLLAGGPAPQPVPPPPALTAPRPAPKPASPPPAAQTQSAPSPAVTQTPAAAQAAMAAQPPAATQAPAAANSGPGSPAAANSASVTPAQQKAAASPVNGGAAMPSPAVPMARPASVQDKVPPGQVFGAQNKNSRVVLHASADTHIIVRGQDGMVYINRTLKAGETYRVPNVPGLSLTSTNAGAVQFELDGQMMGRAGADQETAGDINLNPQAIADRGNSR